MLIHSHLDPAPIAPRRCWRTRKTVLTLTDVIKRGQRSGQVRDGDPRLPTFSALGPLQMALLHDSTFATAGGYSPDHQMLARLHTDVILSGLARPGAAPRINHHSRRGSLT